MNAQTYIDTGRLERIAWATSNQAPGTDEAPLRWTELGLYYRHGERRPFLAESIGASAVEGEAQFRRQRVGKSIDEVSRLFDNSRLADEIALQVDAWAMANPSRAVPMAAPVIAWNGEGGLRGALDWLYPLTVGGHVPTEAGLAIMFEADWGVPTRTVRHTLKQERDGVELPSWCKAFLGALQHFDREAFHATRRT
jgi:hypothetical protein